MQRGFEEDLGELVDEIESQQLIRGQDFSVGPIKIPGDIIFDALELGVNAGRRVYESIVAQVKNAVTKTIDSVEKNIAATAEESFIKTKAEERVTKYMFQVAWTSLTTHPLLPAEAKDYLLYGFRKKSLTIVFFSAILIQKMQERFFARSSN